MPRDPFPTEGLTNGYQWTDSNGVVWVWRVVDGESGAWFRLALVPASSSNIVTAATPTSGQAVTGGAQVDETHYLTPASALAALTWNLPAAADSRVGQIKVLLSTHNITTLTVTVLGGGAKAGNALTTAAANDAYAYQCVSVSGAGTWLRIS